MKNEQHDQAAGVVLSAVTGIISPVRRKLPLNVHRKSLQCSNCGATADIDTVRCAYCRSVLTTTACPNCFTAVFKGVRFCPNCGAAIADSKRA